MRSVAALAVSVVASCLLAGVTADSETYSCTTSTNFDYLELVLQWPVTNCKSSSCNATDAYFTLHGAWTALICPDQPLPCCVPRACRRWHGAPRV